MMSDLMNPAPFTLRRSIFAVWHWPWWAISLAILMVTPSIYFSAYLALLNGPGRVPICRVPIYTDAASGMVYTAAFPDYRLRNLPQCWRSRLLYALEPAHQFDRWLRPQYWATEELL